MTLPVDVPRTSVFCDWLDVTAPPSEDFRIRSEVGSMLCALDGCLKLDDDLFEVGGGKVKMLSRKGWFRISFSGATIRHLESCGFWQGVLAVVGEGPHRVTRVDAALDLSLDGADALELLQAAYPRGEVRLTQRPIRITEMLSTRPDGRKTGTWYAGHRSGAEVSCRVYDKAWQLWQTQGAQEPARTRVELTVRKGPGPTLRDAVQPERLFWQYVSPCILQRPDGVPDWDSGWAEGWVMDKVDILPAAALRRRIEQSGELAALVELADSIGAGGRSMALRWISEKFRGTPGSGSLSDSGDGTVSGGSEAAHNASA